MYSLLKILNVNNKENKLQATEISLWLDSYDDIYSDFDSRNYLKRRVSEDLTDELKAALRYNDEPINQLVLSVPSDLRQIEYEEGIARNIKEQFEKNFERLNAIDKRTISKGVWCLVGGMILMGLNSIIVFSLKTTYLTILLRVVLEPAGWFFFWTGLDLLLNYYKNARRETLIYKKMKHLQIHFKNAEE